MRPTGPKVTIWDKEAGGWGGGTKTNLTFPIYAFVGGDKPLPNRPRVPDGESVTTFLCVFGMYDPRHWNSYFLLRLCFVCRMTPMRIRGGRCGTSCKGAGGGGGGGR